jgi:hypothetical protein
MDPSTWLSCHASAFVLGFGQEFGGSGRIGEEEVDYDAGGQSEYHMNQLNGWVMTGNVETFRQGAIVYRNMRDWTKARRDKFIEAANERSANIPQDISFESSGYSEPST